MLDQRGGGARTTRPAGRTTVFNALLQHENGLSTDNESSSILQRTYLRHRALSMRFERAVLENRSPRALCIDEWTNSVLLSAATGNVTLLNLDTLSKEERPIKNPFDDVIWYPFDSGLFVSSSGQKVRLWDTLRLAAVRTIDLTTRCNQLAFSSVPSSAGVVAAATSHGDIRLINLLSGSAAHTLTSGVDSEILSVAWSPRDSHILISGGADSRLLVWDTRKPNACLAALDELNQEYSLAQTRVLRQQRSSSSIPSRLSTAHSRAAVNSVCFVDDGRCILSTGSDGSVRLWRESSVLNFYHNTQVAFSKRIGGPWGALGYHLSYSKSTGLVFATNAVRDNVVECFDALSGRQLLSFSAHVRKVRCIAFRDDNDPQLYTAADDGFVVKWSCPKLAEDGETEDVDDEDDWSS